MTENEQLATIIRQNEEILERLSRIEAFTDATAEAVAPFLTGKGTKWLALVAKAKGGRA